MSNDPQQFDPDLVTGNPLPEGPGVELRQRLARPWRPSLIGRVTVVSAVLGVFAVVAAPLVWGPLGLIFGLAGIHRRQRLAPVALAIAVIGMLIGALLIHPHELFGDK